MRVLFISSTRVGDAILSSSLLGHLVETYPEARFTIACGPAAANLFEGVPRLDEVIVLTKKRYSMHWFDLYKKCGFRLWNMVVDLRNAPISYLIPGLRKYRQHRSQKRIHRVERMADVMCLPKPCAPRLWTRPSDEAKAQKLIPSTDPILAIGPTANWRAKTWRPEHFAELVARLTAPGAIMAGAKVALFGHESERESAQALIEAIPQDQCLDLIGHLDLLTVLACLKRCSFYVGNDSGLMHLAAASGIPTLGLFGPTQEVFYAPWGENCDFLRTQKPFEEMFPPGFDHRTSDSLMDTLTVDMAEEAALKLWAKTMEARIAAS